MYKIQTQLNLAMKVNFTKKNSNRSTVVSKGIFLKTYKVNKYPDKMQELIAVENMNVERNLLGRQGMKS